MCLCVCGGGGWGGGSGLLRNTDSNKKVLVVLVVTGYLMFTTRFPNALQHYPQYHGAGRGVPPSLGPDQRAGGGVSSQPCLWSCLGGTFQSLPEGVQDRKVSPLERTEASPSGQDRMVPPDRTGGSHRRQVKPRTIGLLWSHRRTFLL